ncbi:MAG: hypothetical protein U0V48_06465 [Anaerolineales bacterium]
MMLTLFEKIIFAIFMIASVYLTYRGAKRIAQQISSGQGKVDWSLASKRTGELIRKYLFFTPVFRFRPLPSLLHAFIGWGFFVYVFVNLNELILAYTGINVLHHTGIPGDIFRSAAEFIPFALMFGMIGMSIRRYILKPATLTTRDTTLLNPKARSGITIDSAIVTATFFTHTLARVFAESFYLARHDIYDAWQPVTSALAGLWANRLRSQLLDESADVLDFIRIGVRLPSIFHLLQTHPFILPRR